MKGLPKSLAGAFALPGSLVEQSRLGRGHIHDTFVASYQSGDQMQRVVHQRINTHVFPRPEALMENLLRVTTHQRRKLEARGVADARRRSLELVPSREGAPFVLDDSGQPWRTFVYVEDARALDRPENHRQARAAAASFAGFTADLVDLAPPALDPPIPHFHDLPYRVGQLRQAVRADAMARATSVARELAWVDELAEPLRRRLGSEGAAALPQRTVHNDCKLNNVLFDAHSDEALCVIDLDTTMAGNVLFDFGDLVRSSLAGEGEAPARAPDLDLFGALAQGYLEGGQSFLEAREVETLHLAGPLLALETGVRFLSDHIEGDHYFRVEHPGQNLERARSQLGLAEQLLARAEELEARVAAMAGA